MDRDSGTGEGRARGRGRGQRPPQQPQQYLGGRGVRPPQLEHTVRGATRGSAAPSPSTAAWGRGAGAGPPPAAPKLTQPSCSTGLPTQRPPAPVIEGRSQSRPGSGPVAAAASAEVIREESRGALRGKRVINNEVIHTRPQGLATKSGSIGQRVTVQANYFRILKKPAWSIHQYRVDFSPDVDVVYLRRRYLGQHGELFGGFLFDGTMLFCAKFIDDKGVGSIELMSKNTNTDETVQIKLKHVGVVGISDAQQVQVLNLILRRAMEGLNLQLVSRNYFDPHAKIDLDSWRIQIWPGYQTSIRQHEQDVLLCTEITHKTMRNESTYNIMTQCTRDSKDWRSVFKREVIGMVVLTDYNNKTYRVDDVDFESTPMSKFDTNNGQISYFEYYMKRYNLTIKDKNQPLLLSVPTDKNMRSGNEEMIKLVPELTRATGLTDTMRKDFRMMKAMSEHTRLNPERRIERLRIFNERLQKSKASMDVLKAWDLQLDHSLVEIPARILAKEKIVFGGDKRYQCDERADWSREFRDTSMFSHVDISRWYVIVPRRSVREVQDFIGYCIKAARGMRMRISEPRYEEMPDDRTASYAQAIDNTVSQDPQILMLVLPMQHEEKYSCIKKRCCVDRPIPSQVVTLKKIAPRGDKGASGLMSIATKVVIQMNAKLMGAPWMIELPLKGLMTVGFDVCHSGKEKNKSFGALVATMDMKVSTRFFSAVTQHMRGQELSNEVGLNMTYALKAYREQHGTLPERIIFYRDGVGDGQLHQVFNTEVQFLKQKLSDIYSSAGVEAGLRMAFIVVSKRINTRYFYNRRNPPPGTVVDDVITLPERFDFYLVSQSVNQGTVSPTSYNVIYDTMGLGPDKLQVLTYKMTHMYYNWAGTCRVPAVCQYAHKLAFLVAESIHRCPSNALENQLYFL